MTIQEQLEERIQEALEAGWSVNQLAREAGLSRTSLIPWLTHGTRSPSAKMINTLCQLFGMRLTKGEIPPVPERNPGGRPEGRKQNE